MEKLEISGLVIPEGTVTTEVEYSASKKIGSTRYTGTAKVSMPKGIRAFYDAFGERKVAEWALAHLAVVFQSEIRSQLENRFGTPTSGRRANGAVKTILG